jgi:hypothetical protein
MAWHGPARQGPRTPAMPSLRDRLICKLHCQPSESPYFSLGKWLSVRL